MLKLPATRSSPSNWSTEPVIVATGFSHLMVQVSRLVATIATLVQRVRPANLLAHRPRRV